MRKTFSSKSASETKKIAKDLAKKVKKTKPKKEACLLVLKGDLGGGKTTFLQGFAKELGIKEKILSPTFVIIKKFKIPDFSTKSKEAHFKHFYHLDCYRLSDQKELLPLLFSKSLSDPENIIAVEWGEKIKKNLPKNIIHIEFKFIDDKKRKIIISR